MDLFKIYVYMSTSSTCHRFVFHQRIVRLVKELMWCLQQAHRVAEVQAALCESSKLYRCHRLIVISEPNQLHIDDI